MIARASSVAFDMFYSNYLTMGTRGGSSKMIERGSYRVKGASGVYTMRERRAGGLGDGSPSVRSRGKAPVGVWGTSPQKLKLFC